MLKCWECPCIYGETPPLGRRLGGELDFRDGELNLRTREPFEMAQELVDVSLPEMALDRVRIEFLR